MMGSTDDGQNGAEVALERRKAQYKVLHKVSVREARRLEVLKRQKEARTDRLDAARELVLRSLGGGTSMVPPGAVGEYDQADPTGGGSEGGSSMAAVEDEQGMADEGDEGGEAVGMEGIEEEEEGEGVRRDRRAGGRRRRMPLSARRDATKYFFSQFSIPEWMVEVPRDLNGKGDFDHGRGWLVMARPEGKRCLLVAHAGATVSRLQSGQVLHKFSSVLPWGGSSRAGRAGGGGGTAFSILDCVFHEADRTYYVVDLLCWKGFHLQDCTAEFRLFFLRSKFDEEMADLSPKHVRPGVHDFRIVPLLYHDADPAGLRQAYEGPVPFLRDGLLLASKAGYYEQGLSPLLLAWKDGRSSRFMLADMQDTAPQAIVLAVSAEPLPARVGGGVYYALETLDGLGVAEMAEAELVAAKLRPGDCVRCRIDRASEAVQVMDGAEGLVARVEGLRVEKACPPSRAVADPWSKILFRSRARAGEAVRIEELLDTAATHVSQLPTGMMES